MDSYGFLFLATIVLPLAVAKYLDRKKEQTQ
jgi:hypothetical protein